MINLDILLKSRDIISFPTKVSVVKALVFSSSHVQMWGLDYKESWVPKNWCFWTAVFKRLLRVPWRVGRSNQSILMEITPEYSLEGLMLKLKLQNFGQLMRRTHLKRLWCWERFKMGGEGDNRGWDGWMPSLTQCTWVWVNSGSWQWTGRPGMMHSMGSQRLSNWTELNWCIQI